MSAVLTLLDVGAAEVVRVLGQVVLAALFGDAVVLGILVDATRISSVAASSGLAVDDHLRRKSHIRPGSVSDDVDSVSNRAGSALSPAGSTVGRNVLILVPGNIVDSINVSPVPILRKVLKVEVFMWSLDSHMFWHQFWRFSLTSGPFTIKLSFRHFFFS